MAGAGKRSFRRTMYPVPVKSFASALGAAFGEKMRSCMSGSPAALLRMAVLASSMDVGDPQGIALFGLNWDDDNLQPTLLANSRTLWQGTHYRSHFLTSHTLFQIFGLHRSPSTQLPQTKLIGIRI
jgi:hypothetical protein